MDWVEPDEHHYEVMPGRLLDVFSLLLFPSSPHEVFFPFQPNRLEFTDGVSPFFEVVDSARPR
jgi:hypothetical protein